MSRLLAVAAIAFESLFNHLTSYVFKIKTFGL